MLFLKKPPFLTTKIEEKNINLSEVTTKDLYTAAFTDTKALFPTVNGEDTDKVEMIQGLTNIAIAGPMFITCELVTKYPKETEEDSEEPREESVGLTIMINEIN